MNIYAALKIGNFHTNHCEDFLVTEQIGSGHSMIAVMDGCTMGKESVFASILIGKILRSIAKERFYKDFLDTTHTDLSDCLKEVLHALFLQLKTIKNQLGIESEELLSTIIIGVIDNHSTNAEFMTVGDGLIYYDGHIIEYEQNDKPDYLGYHLQENFEHWYASQKQRLSIKHFKDLSICTDGIFSFKNFRKRENQKEESQIIQYLLYDKEGLKYDNFLETKIRFLEEKEAHVLTDDLAIIRVLI